jgi:hypothetical protein
MSARSTIALAAVLALLACGPALAQGTVGQSTWGQYPTPVWGTYQSGVGQGGWSYNRQLKPVEPAGSVLADPNQLSSSFGNASTGATLFQPQDTRLKGRDRP